MASAANYVLGHSEFELERLASQARLIDPITRRFFVSAGIIEGMKVLDVGSGAGDVSILLATMVGPEGAVVGTDTAASAVAAAQRRVAAAGIDNVTFRHGDPAEMTFNASFDAVAGRYVLQFMADPAAALKRLARHLRPDGVICFHELDWSGARSAPTVPTYDLACGWIDRTIVRSCAQSHLGPRLASLFTQAGLPGAVMQLESVVASGPAATDAVRLVTDLVATLLPAMERVGVVSTSEVDHPTLERRILAEIGSDAAVIARSEVAAWTNV